MRTWYFLTLSALAGACGSPRYAFRPPEETTIPHGAVEVAALGVTKTKLPERSRLHPVRTLHVQLVVHNGDGELWTLDAFEQRAVINGSLHLEPLTEKIDGEVMPMAVLTPGETRTLDLYYELPPTLDSIKAVPSAQIEWRVRTPSRIIASKTDVFDSHALPRPHVTVVPADPRRLAKDLDGARTDDGMPRPGRAEATGWPSWRD